MGLSRELSKEEIKILKEDSNLAIWVIQIKMFQRYNDPPLIFCISHVMASCFIGKKHFLIAVHLFLLQLLRVLVRISTPHYMNTCGQLLRVSAPMTPGSLDTWGQHNLRYSEVYTYFSFPPYITTACHQLALQANMFPQWQDFLNIANAYRQHPLSNVKDLLSP